MSENVKKEKGQKEKENEDSDEEEKNFAIIPPNGGWGWMVVACAFYCNIVVDGIQLTFGVFLQQISQSFNVDYSRVALAGSLMFGTHLLMGPLCAGFSNEFGLRPVTITGAIICCFGVGLAYFANGYWYLYFTYGVLGGMGLGLIYMNTLIITGVYFTTRMPLAIGIVVCGTGVGTMVFAIMGYFLLRVADWQTSFLIQAGFAGSMGIAAIAFKPLKPIRVKLSSSSSLATTSKRKSTIYSRPKNQKGAVFIKREALRERRDERSSIASIRSLQSLVWDGYLEETIVRNLKQNQFYEFMRCKCCEKCKPKSEIDNDVLVLSEIKNDYPYNRRKSYVEKVDFSEEKNEEDEEEIFSVEGSKSLNQVVFERIDFEKKDKGKFCGQLRRTLINMLDCHLLRSCAFFIFSLSGAVQMASLLIVYIYEIERCKKLGFTEEMSVYFVISLGGANTLWRLLLGGIATIPKINYVALAVSCIVIGGIATMFSGLTNNIYYQFAFCVLFGLGMASFAVFRLILLLDLIEPKMVENATGINLLFMGVTCVIFPPLFGWVMEVTNSYDVIFLTTGFLLCASGCMLIGLKKIQQKELQRKRLVQ